MVSDETIASAIAEVERKILAAVPGAEVTGNPFEGYATATWAPARDANTDYSGWGTWEVWEHCKIGRLDEMTIGPIATGAWVAWNSRTRESQVGNRGDLPSRTQAEMMAVLNNREKPTRVVHADGTTFASTIEFGEAKSWVDRL